MITDKMIRNIELPKIQLNWGSIPQLGWRDGRILQETSYFTPDVMPQKPHEDKAKVKPLNVMSDNRHYAS